MTPSLRKAALRREAVARVLALDPEDRLAQEARLIARFPRLPGFHRAGTVLLHASAFPEEVDTRPLLRLVLGFGKRLVCPRVDRRAGRLRLFAVNDPDLDLAPGALGIPEPKPTCEGLEPDRVDWALVPGVAFDDGCRRLGRGGGYYDRLLPTLRADAPRWALILEPQWVDDLPVEPHDVPLDGVASPSRTALRGQPGRTSTVGGSA